MRKIRVAIAGVGNCALSLLQGVDYYSNFECKGLMEEKIGPYKPSDIEFVCAFDVDKRKVNKTIKEAALAKPNCSMIFYPEFKSSGPVYMAPILDGVADHMQYYEEDCTFLPSDAEPVDVVEMLRKHKPDILINYLPVGSQRAVEMYANACLETKTGMINSMPVFIASNTIWSERFKNAGVPIIGDDIKSQVGATIVHRSLAHLFTMRGYKITRMYQLNTGGNTDFLNMKEQTRLSSKKKSKTQSVTSNMDQYVEPKNIYIGPSDWVQWQKDNKVAFIRIEGEGFGGAPIEMEMRLSVQDSPNSAGVVIEAIRYMAVAQDNNISGALLPSSYLMKSPPIQMEDNEARKACKEFSNIGEIK